MPDKGFMVIACPPVSGLKVALCVGMTFAASLNHVKLQFVEMPRLELTVGQAVRLWGLGADDCRFVIDALVDEGFLRWTPKRTIARNRRSHQVSNRVGRVDAMRA